MDWSPLELILPDLYCRPGFDNPPVVNSNVQTTKKFKLQLEASIPSFVAGSSRALMIVKEIERGLSLSTWTKNFNVDFLWQREEYPGGYRKESPGQGGQRMSTLTFFDTLSEITSVCNVLLVANEGQR